MPFSASSLSPDDAGAAPSSSSPAALPGGPTASLLNFAHPQPAGSDGSFPSALFHASAAPALSAEAFQALLLRLSSMQSTPSLRGVAAAADAFSQFVPVSGSFPLQLLPPGTVLVPLTPVAHPSLLRVSGDGRPHPKLSTLSSSPITHVEVPSSESFTIDGRDAKLSPQPGSPPSPLSPPSMSLLTVNSASSVSSASSSSSAADSRRRMSDGGHGRSGVARGKRSSPSSETESDDSSDSHSTDSLGDPSDPHGESSKKRRCVVSAQKLPTDTSHLDMSLSVVCFQDHSIRIIHTFDRFTQQRSTYVHGADVGGVIERKSNISRMFGQFESPREKVLMNVTGKHNHTVGQEANVLTVEGVRRLMSLKKCQPHTAYQQWLRDVLVPRLQQQQQQQQQQLEAQPEAAQVSASRPTVVVTAQCDDGQKSASPLDVMATVCVGG